MLPAVADPAPSALDVIHRTLGARYTLERELGRGGMGAVYLARDLRLDRAVALKVLPAEYASQGALRERFLRETRTAAGFSHPNIVPVYAVEESEELLAYAMGLVEGETLAERVRRAGPLPPREIARVLQDVGYALAYAHGRGVVHRDIKPDNVMIERATGRALVMDFGISRSMTQSVPAAGLTRVGEVVGTPEYMSPEQASGDVVDGRSDLYALGLTAWFAATGRPAMTGDNTQKVLVRQLTERVPPVGGVRPDLPAPLAAAIDRCVAKDPAERFPTAETLVDAIDAAQLSEPDIPVPIRLFAGDAATLSLIGAFMIGFSAFLVRIAWRNDTATLDVMLVLVLLFAILLTRALTTLSEARRLAVAGFTTDDVMNGLARVGAERAGRRAELRADPETRRRRRATIIAALAMLAMSLVMMYVASGLRIRLAGGTYRTPLPGIVLVMSGAALLGTSVVLLIRSPFRMPPGERLFRLVWLGAPGRVFVRVAARGAARSGTTLTRRSVPATPGAAALVTPTPSATPPVALPVSLPAGTPAPDRLAALESRVAELERWRGQA